MSKIQVTFFKMSKIEVTFVKIKSIKKHFFIIKNSRDGAMYLHYFVGIQITDLQTVADTYVCTYVICKHFKDNLEITSEKVLRHCGSCNQIYIYFS
jgi:hypothetical protein